MEVAHQFCHVAGCRHPNSHITHHHRCGRCGEFGHGQMECRNNRQIENLHMAQRRELPRHMWCNMIGCEGRRYHTTEAHHCPNCGENHSIVNCNIQSLEEQFNRYGRSNDIAAYMRYINNALARTHIHLPNGIHIETYAGMGCMLYIRAHINQPIQAFFLHSDNMGQYGAHTSHIPQRDRFIEGFQEIADVSRENLLILQQEIADENNINNVNINNVDVNNINNIIPAPIVIPAVELQQNIFEPNVGYAYQRNLERVELNCPFCRAEVNTGNAELVEFIEPPVQTEENECVICLSEVANIRFPECAHQHICEGCFRIMANYDPPM